MVAAFGEEALKESQRQIRATLRKAVADNLTPNQLRRLLDRR